MKKLFAALLVLPFLAFVAADWVTVQLDEKVSVSFPSAPQEKEMAGNQVWVQDIDKDARCMAMVLDFSKFGLDSAGLAEEMGKDQAFADFRGGILGQIQGATLISEKKGKINGKIYFEYVINMGKNDDKDALNIMYSRNIFVSNKMYTLSFYEKNNMPREKDRNKFYNSFKLAY
ncbi:MAG: hypothetical protein ABW019_05035 [Chitinophagaceae bacterium]